MLTRNRFFNPDRAGWYKVNTIENRAYICGYCGEKVASDRGYKLGEHSAGGGKQIGGLYICSNCQGPTFFTPEGEKLPGEAVGNPVDNVPEELEALYNEARRCASQSCYTAAVMVCRKMLMNIAVDQGAEDDLRFIEYVNFLSDNGFTPPHGKHWVDHIRNKGNEANHEIELMSAQDAKELIVFAEMLLRFIYEFPSMIPDPQAEE